MLYRFIFSTVPAIVLNWLYGIWIVAFGGIEGMISVKDTVLSGCFPSLPVRVIVTLVMATDELFVTVAPDVLRDTVGAGSAIKK